jgi:hypothetical protein
MRRFSPKLLFRLRNEIPVPQLVADTLKLPHKISEGHFRFLCPACREFNTAVNPRTNLGRCFRCARNFNPIDLVMAVFDCNFIDAVQFLQRLLLAKVAGAPVVDATPQL